MSLNPRGTLRSAAAAGVVGILLFPAMLAIACPPLPPRAGAEIVNPYVLARAYDATSSGFEAFERVGIPANDSLQELGQPALAFDRVALESSDDSRWVTDLAILEGLFDTQVYRFVVNPSDVNASNLVFSWEGFGEFQPGPQTYLMAFNHTRGGWDNLTHYGFTTPVDRVLTGEISGSVSDYILNNTVTLLVASVKGRIKSSCPMLFAWNGSAYGFVTDFLGDGIIGMPVLANLIRFPADPTEYLMVGKQDKLAPVGDSYSLKIVEELEEVTYLDQVYLMAVDHPSRTEAHPNERGMYFPPWPDYGMLVFSDARHPVAAWDDRGNDVLPLISAHDRLYPPVPLASFREGFAEPHDLYLDLGAFSQSGPVQLLLDSWIRFVRNDDDGFYANTQGWYDGPPSIAVSDGNGSYTVVNNNVGIPMGLPKTWVVDLTGMFPTSNHTVRISSRLQIYFDEIRVTTDAGAFPSVVTNTSASAADLHFLGFPKFKSPDGRRPYAPDYYDVTALSPWRNQPGNYTRYGDVAALLAAHDDKYVVMGPGDEISLEVPASDLPPLPSGWVRDFVFFVDGYMKEIHPAVPEDYDVEPLPYHNMTSYPYSGNETFPNDPEHSAYIAHYNTRYVGPGGAWPGTASVESDYLKLDALQPVTLGELDAPLFFNASWFDQVTYRRSTVFVDGNITIAPGATLTLDHARLFMNGSDKRILVQAGGSLRILNGSVVSDSPYDTDDGSGADLHYWIEVQPGGEFVLDDSRIENAGLPAGTAAQRGVYVADAGAIFCNASISGGVQGISFDGTTNVSVENLEVSNSSGFDIDLVNGSRVDAVGLNFSNLGISPDSTLILRTAVDVLVRDTSGKPIRGADLKLTDNGRAIYASSGYGGADPQTRRATDFEGNPIVNTVFAVARVYLGSTTPTVNVSELSAKYFEWAETRAVDTTAPHLETLTMSLNTTSFTDRAAALGFDQGPRNYSYWDSLGPSVSVADFNGDGLLDMFVSGGATRGEREGASASPNRLYRQESNHAFTDVTNGAGLTSTGATGAAWGDYDNDGDPDLYVVYYGWGGGAVSGQTRPLLDALGEANALYRNNGDGTFSNVTLTAGVGDNGHGTSAAWGDYDGDGWLDLYVGNLGWIQGWFVRNESDVLYHNNHDGSFTDVTAQLKVWGGGPARRGDVQETIFLGGDNATPLARDSPEGSGLTTAVAWLDYDRDGDLDLFVANDFGVSVLYRNDGGNFTVVTQQAGLKKVGSARGVTVADINGDGWLDIIQTNRWVDFVWRSNRDGTFTDVAPALGLDTELPGTSPTTLDFNLDGLPDLFVGGGRINSFNTYAPVFLYSNRGAAGFADVTASAGVALGGNRTMGAAAADFNGDGRPDLALANADQRNNLFINEGPAGGWLKVRLQGTASPRDGQGSVVTLVDPALSGAGPTPSIQLGAVGQRGSQNPAEALFGLGARTISPAAPMQVRIAWSSGVQQTVNVTAANQTIMVVERAETYILPITTVVVNEDVPATFNVALVSTDPKVNATASAAWVVHLRGGDIAFTGLPGSYTFDTPGVYAGVVTVVDRTRQGTSSNFTLRVIDVTPPVATAQTPPPALEGGSVTLSANGTRDNDPDFALTGNFSWSFTEDGRPVTLYGQSVKHVFAGAGTYDVTLTVRDAAGNTNTTTLQVQVTRPEGFGLREAAILLLVVAALLVLVVALLRARRGGPPPSGLDPQRSGSARVEKDKDRHDHDRVKEGKDDRGGED